LHSLSGNPPFFDYPTIKVRGISGDRLRHVLSWAVKNEEQLYICDNLIFIFLYDIGRVGKNKVIPF
jgi:hypothetical protein